MKIQNIFAIVIWLLIVLAYICFLFKLDKDLKRHKELKKEKEDKNV